MRTSLRLRRKIRSLDAPVEAMAFIRGSTLSYLVVLCSKTLTIHRSSDLELLMTVPLTNVASFAVNEGVPFPGLAVVESTSLHIYNLQYGFELCKVFSLPEQPLSVAWNSSFIVVGHRDEYSLMSEANGSVQLLTNTEGAQPYVRTLPTEDLLVITKQGMQIIQPIGWRASSYKLAGPIRSIAYSFPYIFSLSGKERDQPILEIRNMLNYTYHEYLRLPSPISSKAPLVLSDDSLNVYLLDQSNLYAVVPALLSSQNEKSIPIPVSDALSQSTPGRSEKKIDPGTPTVTTPTKSSTPASAKARGGIFTFTTTFGPDSHVPSEPSSPSSKSGSKLSSSMSSAPMSAPATPRSAASLASLQSPALYHIPPPSPGDKNGFIRYIRTILKQEHNPYRLLLVSYAERVVSELESGGSKHPGDHKSDNNPKLAEYHLNQPKPLDFASRSIDPNIKIEEVKRVVAVFYRRFLKTFSLEFKAYQSKTMRELLTVAVAVSFHSLLANILLPILNAQFSEQDKHYNQKLASIHAIGFHPGQFEIRPKFWLTHDSVTAEEEKDASKRSAAQAALRSSTDEGKETNGSSNSATSRDSDPASHFSAGLAVTNGSWALNGQDTSTDAETDVTNFDNPDPAALSSASLKQFFLDIPPQKLGSHSGDDGSGSSATDDGEEYAVDFRPNSPHPNSLFRGSPSNERYPSNMRAKNIQKQTTNMVSEQQKQENSDSDRTTLGEAKLYFADIGEAEERNADSVKRLSRGRREGPDNLLSSAEFVLLDTVLVSYDAEHHLYFTFIKSGIEKELAPSEWNFVFKDEERAVYWRGSDEKFWRLCFPKREKQRSYVEFTTRWRLYEQQSANFLNNSMLSLPHSGDSKSTDLNSKSPDMFAKSPSSSEDLKQGSLDISNPSTPSTPSTPLSNGLMKPGSEKSQHNAPSSMPKVVAKPDLRRVALESSLSSSVPASYAGRELKGTSAIDSPKTPSNNAGMDARIGVDSPSISGSLTPLHSEPSSPTSRSRDRLFQSASDRPSTPRGNSENGNTTDYPYCAAVRTLRLVSKQRTPREKIETMARALSYVTAAVDEFWAPKSKKVIVGADDLVPIFSYVVALAKVPNIYSEMTYALEFSTESSLRGKYGYSIATLQICVEHVIQVATQIEQEQEQAFSESSSDPSLALEDRPGLNSGLNQSDFSVSESVATSGDASSVGKESPSSGISSPREAHGTSSKPGSAKIEKNGSSPVSPLKLSDSRPSSPSGTKESLSSPKSPHSGGSAPGSAKLRNTSLPPSPHSSDGRSPAGSGKIRMKNDGKPQMRVQDLIGKMQSMATKKRDDDLGSPGISDHHHHHHQQMASNPESHESLVESAGAPSSSKFSAAASSSSNSAVQSPSLSPMSSRPSTPSPPSSSKSANGDVKSPKVAVTTPSIAEFSCSALEVSQPQIDGKMWVTSTYIEFEGMFKEQKRTVRVALTSILAIKKSWGMFGGDGIDIYATKDVIVFFRHFQAKARDEAYDKLIAAIQASGHPVILK